MAHPTQFGDAVLGPPIGQEDSVSPLPVHKLDRHVVSCWELTDEEMLEVMSSRRIFLAVCGETHPPLFIGSGTTMLRLLHTKYPPISEPGSEPSQS